MNSGLTALIVVAISVIAFVGVMYWLAREISKRRKRSKEPLGVWLFSGIKLGDNNARTDAGCFRCPSLMTEAEALQMLPTLVPRAVVIHVDRDNFIITFQV